MTFTRRLTNSPPPVVKDYLRLFAAKGYLSVHGTEGLYFRNRQELRGL